MPSGKKTGRSIKPIAPRAKETKRQAVTRQLLALVRELPTGAQIPSQRQLAEDLQVSQGTLQAAIKDLIASGVLAGQPGSGTFVANAEKAKQSEKAPAKLSATVEVVRAEPPHFGDDAYTFPGEEDQERITKSAYIPVGTYERAKAIVGLMKVKVYNNPEELAGKVPTTLNALFHIAVNRMVDDLEEAYNEGQAARRIYQLPVGTSEAGVARAAAAARARKARGT